MYMQNQDLIDTILFISLAVWCYLRQRHQIQKTRGNGLILIPVIFTLFKDILNIKIKCSPSSFILPYFGPNSTTNVPINNLEFIYFSVLMVVESTMAVKQDHPQATRDLRPRPRQEVEGQVVRVEQEMESQPKVSRLVVS